MIRWAVFVAALLVLAGCVSSGKLREKDLREVRYQSGGYAGANSVLGLREAIAKAQADTDSPPIRVLTIHGILTNQPDFSLDTQRATAARLGLKAQERILDIPLVRGYEVVIFDGVQPTGESRLNPSILRRRAWVDDKNVPRLIYYELLWAPFRDEIKGKYFACFESPSFRRSHGPRPDSNWQCPEQTNAKGNTNSASLINRGIKEGILVDGVSDALIVTGAMGKVLKDDLNNALCTIAIEELAFPESADPLYAPDPDGNIQRCGSYLFSEVETIGPDGTVSTEVFDYSSVFGNRPFFMVTESLGSYFLFRTIWERGSEEASFMENLSDSMINNSTVFMFANQTGLLHLSALEPVCIPDPQYPKCPNPNLETLDEKLNTFSARSNLTTYVAFNDRDDILGFELSPYLLESGLAGRLINVSVKNPTWGVPGVFRWFEGAHTNQPKNRAIVHAIVEGICLPRESQTCPEP